MARWTGGTFTLSAGDVTDAAIATTTTIDADKLEHVHKPGSNFDLAIGATPVAREEIVYVAKNAATIRSFHALLNDTGTSTDVDFDVKVNGTTALSSTVNVTHSDSDRAVKDGTLNTTSLSADDVVSVELTVTSSTGAQGPFCWVEIEETA